tara:strand:- start:583 stop:1707 length:1125 start_codon:yes stop_codon:yes gene_type:complete
MAYYNYNNANLILGSGAEPKTFLVQDLGISLDNQVSPVYLVPNKSSFDYRANRGLIGTIDFTYFLTGSDFLKDFIVNEKQQITGSCAGLTFKSGFLSTYSFTVEQYGPVVVTAAISFHGGIEGTFTPDRTNIDVNKTKILNFSDCTITELSGVAPSTTVPTGAGVTTVVPASMSNANFAFQSNFTPVYLAGQSVPKEIKFNKKNITTSIGGYNIGLDTLTLSGAPGEMKFNFADSGENILETFKVRGILTSASLNVSAGEKIETNITLMQEKIGEAPLFSGINPYSGYAHELISLSGKYFSNTTSVRFGEDLVPTTGISIVSDTLIQVRVPEDAVMHGGSGKGTIEVTTVGGNVFWPNVGNTTQSGFKVNDRGF